MSNPSISEILVSPGILHSYRERIGISVATMQGALLLGRDLVAYYLKQKIADLIAIDLFEAEFSGKRKIDPEDVNYALLFSIYNDKNPIPDKVYFNTDQVTTSPLVVCYVPTNFRKIKIMGYVPTELLKEIKEEVEDTDDVFRLSFNNSELMPIEDILGEIDNGEKWRLDSEH